MALESTRLSAIIDKSAATNFLQKTATKKTTQVLHIKPKRDTKAVIEALTTRKLGLKNKFQRVTKTLRESTSTGSLRSSDTGYSSASPDAQQTIHQPMNKSTKRLIDTEYGPMHSTPIVQQTRKRRNCEIETTLDEEFDELKGKSQLLRKFMEDHCIDGAPTKNSRPVVPEIRKNNHKRTEKRPWLPAFAMQEEKCRYFWNQYCESESEGSDVSSMNSSTMDIAFLDSFVFESTKIGNMFANQKTKKLRRESAISNLTKFSLRRKMAEMAEETVSSYDYSFDC